LVIAGQKVVPGKKTLVGLALAPEAARHSVKYEFGIIGSYAGSSRTFNSLFSSGAMGIPLSHTFVLKPTRFVFALTANILSVGVTTYLLDVIVSMFGPPAINKKVVSNARRTTAAHQPRPSQRDITPDTRRRVGGMNGWFVRRLRALP
jgi:hypothetical protein